MKKVAIVGGGAAGLFAAAKLSVCDDCSVVVFEKSSKVGTKLRASGGGRANLLNRNIQPCHYNHAPFMEIFLKTVNESDIVRDFENMGLRLCADEEGRIYPATFFSQTVIDVLMANMSPKVQICTETPVRHLQKVGKKWSINDDKKTFFDAVVLASGSPAGMIPKNQQGYNSYLADLKLSCSKLTPSLSGFTIKDYPKELSGCRAKVTLSLACDGKVCFKEDGEVIFKDDGISGIVVLNASSFYNRLKTKEKCYLSLDFLCGDDSVDISSYLKKFGTLSGLLHPKLNRLFQRHPFDVRDFRLEIQGLYGMEFAQVCHGGISLQELNADFSLVRFPGLYAIGEMLDIDGVCGGYNLFFAFASAHRAVDAINLL